MGAEIDQAIGKLDGLIVQASSKQAAPSTQAPAGSSSAMQTPTGATAVQRRRRLQSALACIH